MLVAEESIVNVTAFPEEPPDAATEYVAPPTTAPEGAVDENVIVCDESGADVCGKSAVTVLELAPLEIDDAAVSVKKLAAMPFTV
jgi:hypothetical protein